MPSILALRRASIAGVDLGHTTFQIGLGASRLDDMPCFALVYRYPPATTGAFRPQDGALLHFEPGSTALVQVPISLGENTEEIERIAAVSAGSGTEETDLRRMAEGFEMMKNRARSVAQDRIDACVRDATEVVKAYNQLRTWIADGMVERAVIRVVTSYAQREGQELVTRLVCMP